MGREWSTSRKHTTPESSLLRGFKDLRGVPSPPPPGQTEAGEVQTDLQQALLNAYYVSGTVLGAEDIWR